MLLCDLLTKFQHGSNVQVVDPVSVHYLLGSAPRPLWSIEFLRLNWAQAPTSNYLKVFQTKLNQSTNDGALVP